jgi:NAD(P)-dependent dehydrogenase (short-subunit alcohol dehydrogenase family)
MPGKIDGKVAVVTGAATGIGQAFARRLSEDGANVVVADISPAEDTVRLVERAGRQALACRCDVTSPDDVANLATQVQQWFGGCDILVNNAGIYPVANFEEMTFSDWRKVMSVNLDSVFLTCSAFVPEMKRRGWGRIINMASSTLNSVVPRMTHYIASKGGVVGVTRGLASDLGPYGITVNAISPMLTRTPNVVARGPVLTGKTNVDEELQLLAQTQAIKRPQVPEDLVGIMSFLSSDESGFMTGQTIFVDGGKVRA